MFGRVVIQKHLRKMYSVKSAFAKVARNRSIIFNYTLDQDFPIIILSFLLNNIYISIYKKIAVLLRSKADVFLMK